MMERPETLDALQECIGIAFLDVELLRQAVTHTSFRNEHADIEYDNERLEFLGDAVIECAVSDLLWRRYPEASEGMLTRRRSYLVRVDGLAECSRALGLGEHLLLGRGEEMSGGRQKDSLLADAFESLSAAIYLDQGLEVVSRFVGECLAERILRLEQPQSGMDFKTSVQEWVQAQLRFVPRYRVDREHGPDHEKTFEVSMTLKGTSVAKGSGRSKKEAEQVAAKEFLDALTVDDSLLDPFREDPSARSSDGHPGSDS